MGAVLRIIIIAYPHVKRQVTATYMLPWIAACYTTRVSTSD